MIEYIAIAYLAVSVLILGAVPIVLGELNWSRLIHVALFWPVVIVAAIASVWYEGVKTD